MDTRTEWRRIVHQRQVPTHAEKRCLNNASLLLYGEPAPSLSLQICGMTADVDPNTSNNPATTTAMPIASALRWPDTPPLMDAIPGRNWLPDTLDWSPASKLMRGWASAAATTWSHMWGPCPKLWHPTKQAAVCSDVLRLAGCRQLTALFLLWQLVACCMNVHLCDVKKLKM